MQIKEFIKTHQADRSKMWIKNQGQKTDKAQAMSKQFELGKFQKYTKSRNQDKIKDQDSKII